MTAERGFRTLRVASFFCEEICFRTLFAPETRGNDGKESRKEEGARSFLPTVARFWGEFAEDVQGRLSKLWKLRLFLQY